MAVENTTVTRDLRNLEGTTGNIYESIAIIAKRANQIGLNVKEELNAKLSEFATSSDNLEELSKTASKSKFLSITSVNQNQHWLPSTNIKKGKFITAVR